jgi:hypothetical protein
MTKTRIAARGAKRRVTLIAALTSLAACGSGASPTDAGTTDGPAGLAEFEQFRAGFGVLEALAGAGKRSDDENEWNAAFEGGAATAAELSSPHNALGDADGNVFIADKDAHAIRKVTPDGIITTVAGVNLPGDDGDGPLDGRAAHLSSPNGIWVSSTGVVYILDLGNLKIRRLGTNGQLTTLFAAATLGGGRGLWVAEDESLAYVSASGDLLRWTPVGGVEIHATGFTDLGNLAVAPDGVVFATDRGQNLVSRVDVNGAVTAFAGNGLRGRAVEGAIGKETPLDEVRGIWRTGRGFLLGTHHGSQVLYLDSFGSVHSLIDGTQGAHCCDGQPLSSPEQKISEVRNVTLTPMGDLLVIEHDAGFVRIARHLP